MEALIAKTRDGVALTPDEIRGLVAGVVDRRWPDYQLAAWLMAAFIRGLTRDEVFWLTQAMAESGSPPAAPLGRVDKHSTGGVGDKTTLAVAPLVSSLGIPVAKMSGRGLGHTGGTIDKLESIPGFRAQLSAEAVRQQLAAVGVAVIAQSGELAPADARLYALRDVTATVDSIPLIAASIMSKKLAAKAPYLVLDVKVGNGALVPQPERAEALARLMVDIGTAHGRQVHALLTNMDQPLGYAVGNAIEVNEAVALLRGDAAVPDDFRAVVLAVAGEMVALAEAVAPAEAARRLRRALDAGQGYQQFLRWVTAQGGDPEAVTRGLPLAPVHRVLTAERDGWVQRIATVEVGRAALELGAGRKQLDDRIDPAVGLRCLAKVGQPVTVGQPLAEVFARRGADADAALGRLAAAISLSETPPAPPWPPVLKIIRGEAPPPG